MADQFRLRLSLIDGPELRCPRCACWYPIDTEHWEKNEWHMCLACKREKARLYAKLRQRDAEYRTRKAEASRRYRNWLKEVAPQYLLAYERDKRARNREKARERRALLKEQA